MSIIQKPYFPFSIFFTEADQVTTAFISPEDLIPSTQPPEFPPAPILLPTPKTTVHHKKSTSQPSTTKPDTSTPQPLTTYQPSYTQPQTSTFPSTTYPQTSTTTQVSTEDRYTTKQQLITTQQQISKTTPNPIPTQTNPPSPQSTVPGQATVTQDNRPTGDIQPSTKQQRLRTNLRSQGTSKHQTTDSYRFHRTTSLYPSSTITHFEQKPNTKSPRKHTYMSTTFLTSPTTLTSKQDDVVSGQTTHTNKQSIFSTKPFMSKEYSTHPHHTNIEPEPTTQPIQPHTTFWYQPHIPSTTTQSSSTSKHHQSSTKHYPKITKTATYSPKTKSQFANPSRNPKKQLPGTSRNLELKPTKSKPFAKSDAIRDSPVPNEVANRTRGNDVTFFISQPCCVSPLRVNHPHRTQ